MKSKITENTERRIQRHAYPIVVVAAVFAFICGIGITSASGNESAVSVATVSLKNMADALHLVLDSDRTVYTRTIVNRLVKKDKVIKASEHFDKDKALALPAQMFRFGSELVKKRQAKMKGLHFSYRLESLWPINKQNAPKTPAEKKGLKYVVEHKGKNFYTTEKLGNETYFTAVYADTAVAPVCAACHNAHADSPRHDFKPGDVMGGVVIRIPI